MQPLRANWEYGATESPDRRDGKMAGSPDQTFGVALGEGTRHPYPILEENTVNRAELHSAWAPRLLSILRIVTGLLFLEHGTQKLLGFPPSPNPGPALESLLGIQGVLELGGGILILLGLFTRPVAFLLAGNMAVAYFMAHAPKSFFPALNGGDAAILFCFVFLYLFAAGGGPWSVDAGRSRGSTPVR